MSIELGKQYRTRDGREVRIYAVDGGGMLSVHGAHKTHDDSWASQLWDAEGRRYSLGSGDAGDLVEVSPTISRTYWLTFYGDPRDGPIQIWGIDPHGRTDHHDMPPHSITGPHEITFTEGQGLE